MTSHEMRELEKFAEIRGYNTSEVFYDALMEAGVENWEGYKEAFTLYKKFLNDIAQYESESEGEYGAI